MITRHKIQVLREAGHTQREVAELAGVSERSVRRIEEEPTVVSFESKGERKRRRVGRPNLVEPFRQPIVEMLKSEPHLLSVEILRRVKLDGYQGKKSALFSLISSLRPKDVRPMVRFEGLPGEFSQHDFGQVNVKFMNGTKKRIHFFATRLKYSRWAEVSIVEDERVESLVRTLVEHFSSIGGIPLLAVFDRPKTIAQKWNKNGEVTQWNSTFASVMFELGLGVELCWPRRGQEKGSVENLVGWVKGSFFKQRRFWDEEDLQRQLKEWHVEVNTQTSSRATGVIPAVRKIEEQPRLRPLRVTSENLALRIPIYVGPTGMVLHDTHQYSVDPETIGMSGTLFLYRDKVRIEAGRFEATHDRLFERGAKSKLPQHRAAMVAKVSGRRGKRYLKREHLIELGEVAMEYVTEIVHRRPRSWINDIDKLHDLLQQLGPDKLRLLFKQALSKRVFGAEYIRQLTNNCDEPSESSSQQVTVQTELLL